MTDAVNPQHYKNYRIEVIDIIEDAVARAPDPVLGGYQWQVIKYALRMWDKESPVDDIGKLIWYAKRLKKNLKSKSENEWTGEDIEPSFLPNIHSVMFSDTV